MNAPVNPPALLRRLLADPKILVAPGIYDGLTALLAERAGFKALYITGSGIANNRFGQPDIGLVSMKEVADTDYDGALTVAQFQDRWMAFFGLDTTHSNFGSSAEEAMRLAIEEHNKREV